MNTPCDEPKEYDTITVERLAGSTWEPCAWMDMRVGDIVRFRNEDGTLQCDRDVASPDGTRWTEVRDWVVDGPPRAREGRTPSHVAVWPRDADRAEGSTPPVPPLIVVDSD